MAERNVIVLFIRSFVPRITEEVANGLGQNFHGEFTQGLLRND